MSKIKDSLEIIEQPQKTKIRLIDAPSSNSEDYIKLGEAIPRLSKSLQKILSSNGWACYAQKASMEITVETFG